MSWAAHDLEPYAIQRHFGVRVAFVPLVIGSYSPDILSKWFVYGINVLGAEIRADDPVQFHRGWPGVGFTHSLGYGLLIAGLIWLILGSRIWAFSFLLGHWAHALTDAGDTIGTMLFFPLSTETFGLGAWAYAGQYGRLVDAGAYFSGLGFVWDGVFLVYGLLSWRMFKREYFHEVIVKADPRFWGWMGRRLPETALLALYRASFFYGSTRWIAWLIWAHVVHDFPLDLSWGGPGWIDAAYD